MNICEHKTIRRVTHSIKTNFYHPSRANECHDLQCDFFATFTRVFRINCRHGRQQGVASIKSHEYEWTCVTHSKAAPQKNASTLICVACRRSVSQMPKSPKANTHRSVFSPLINEVQRVRHLAADTPVPKVIGRQGSVKRHFLRPAMCFVDFSTQKAMFIIIKRSVTFEIT